MYKTERIFIVTALVVVGLALVVGISQGLLGSEDQSLAGLVWLMGLALVVVASVGALWVGRLAPGAGSRSLPVRVYPILRIPLDITIPALLAAGSVLFLQMFSSVLLQALIVLLAGAATAAALWSLAHGLDPGGRHFALAQTSLNVISHLTAFFLFSVIYGLKVRAMLSATAVAIITALLLFELLSRDAAWRKALDLPVHGRQRTLGLLALAAGLVAGELTWGLNYWAALSALVGGAFLLVVFYVLHGLASAYVDARLDRQIFVEYSVVGTLGMAVVLASAFLS